MLHIVLTILAVIGKILLGLLGFILLLLLLILLVPIRYQGTFQNQNKDMQARASVSWLLRFVHVQVAWIEKKLSFEVYLLGIPLFRFLNWLKGKNGKKKKKSQTAEKESLESTMEATPEQSETLILEEKREETETEDIPQKEKESVSLREEQSEGQNPELIEEQIQEQAEVQDQKIEKTGVVRKLKTVFGKIFGILQKLLKIPQTVVDKLQAVKEKLKTVLGKAETLRDKVKEILDILKSKMFREVFSVVKKEVLAILRHILPQKIWGNIEYGTGDPGTTGEILAAVAVIYPVLPKKLGITPDFEEALLRCDLSLKGRIRLVVLVFHGIKIILNKQVRRLIKKVRHKEA